jgi:hypothetical protein
MVALALLGLDRLVRTRPYFVRFLVGALGGISICITAPSAVLFPHLPSSMANPFFEGTLTLIKQGLVPFNILGLPPPLAALIFVIALTGVLAYLLIGGSIKTVAVRMQIGLSSLMFIALFLLVFYELYPIDYGKIQWFQTLARDVFSTEPLW